MVQCCPLTSEENMVAQVPMHQHTTGFVILPRLIASQILYSSVPPICRTQTVVTVRGQSKTVVLIITHLSQDDNHLHSRSVLITQDMVSKHRAWVSRTYAIRTYGYTPVHTRQLCPADQGYLPVPTNGHTFKNAIGGAGNDVVEFIGHAP